MNTLNKEAELIYILQVLHSFPFDFYCLNDLTILIANHFQSEFLQQTHPFWKVTYSNWHSSHTLKRVIIRDGCSFETLQKPLHNK